MQTAEFLENMQTGVILGAMMRDDQLAKVALDCDHEMFEDHKDAVELSATAINWFYQRHSLNIDWERAGAAMNWVAERVCKHMNDNQKINHVDLNDDEGIDWWNHIDSILESKTIESK